MSPVEGKNLSTLFNLNRSYCSSIKDDDQDKTVGELSDISCLDIKKSNQQKAPAEMFQSKEGSITKGEGEIRTSVNVSLEEEN